MALRLSRRPIIAGPADSGPELRLRRVPILAEPTWLEAELRGAARVAVVK
jgi:hypothetical protein